MYVHTRPELILWEDGFIRIDFVGSRLGSVGIDLVGGYLDHTSLCFTSSVARTIY